MVGHLMHLDLYRGNLLFIIIKGDFKVNVNISSQKEEREKELYE